MSIDFRGIPLDPSVEGGMIQRQTLFRQHLFYIVMVE